MTTKSEIAQNFAQLREQSTPRWRLKAVKKGSEKVNGKYPPGAKAAFIPYIDARFVHQRLDDVVGPENWRTHVAAVNPDGSVIVRLEIRVGGEWLWKEDVGYPNNPDSKLADADQLKGAVSDATKRAAVQFGVGRFLYALAPQWVEIDEWGAPKRPILAGATATSPVSGDPVDVSTGEVLAAKPIKTQPGVGLPKRDVTNQGDDGDPSTWTGVRAFWRNKIDGAASAPALDKLTPSVVAFVAEHGDTAVGRYLEDSRRAVGLPTAVNG
jgi:hypothetical protein